MQVEKEKQNCMNREDINKRKHTEKQRKDIYWKKPAVGWVKGNFDGNYL
jgi:hypothetical protein